MTTQKHPLNKSHGRLLRDRARQEGVVLIVSLIMLTIVSILVVFSMREATTTESITNNTRLSALATQAAEAALRYCEIATVYTVKGTGTLDAAAPKPGIQTWGAGQTAWLGQTISNWDSSPRTGVFALPLAVVNQSTMGATYQRPPECVVEQMPLINADGSTNTTAAYMITARGFGPEVPAVSGSSFRPSGSEVFLQSAIQLN